MKRLAIVVALFQCSFAYADFLDIEIAGHVGIRGTNGDERVDFSQDGNYELDGGTFGALLHAETSVRTSRNSIRIDSTRTVLSSGAGHDYSGPLPQANGSAYGCSNIEFTLSRLSRLNIASDKLSTVKSNGHARRFSGNVNDPDEVAHSYEGDRGRRLQVGYGIYPPGPHMVRVCLSTGPNISIDRKEIESAVQRSLDVTLIAPGDANDDLNVNQHDIIALLAAGKYRLFKPALWHEGDFNFDGLFNQLDLIEMLQEGHYTGPSYAAITPVRSDVHGQVALAYVPEPSGFLLFVIGLLAYGWRPRTKGL